MQLYDVSVWYWDRLIATAKDIVAKSHKDAAKRGVQAIQCRKRKKDDPRMLDLFYHVTVPGKPAPDGVKVYVARKERGRLVVG